MQKKTKKTATNILQYEQSNSLTKNIFAEILLESEECEGVSFSQKFCFRAKIAKASHFHRNFELICF